MYLIEKDLNEGTEFVGIFNTVDDFIKSIKEKIQNNKYVDYSNETIKIIFGGFDYMYNKNIVNNDDFGSIFIICDDFRGNFYYKKIKKSIIYNMDISFRDIKYMKQMKKIGIY